MDDAPLVERLRGVLPEGPSLLGIVRRPNPFEGAFRSEIVDCDLGTIHPMTVLLKWGRRGAHEGHGYWGGTAYEALIYEELLPTPPLYATPYLGTIGVPGSREPCLVLRFLAGHLRLSKCPKTALVQVAEWLGSFHAQMASGLGEAPAPTRVPRYDEEYFRGWILRARAYAEPILEEVPWMESISQEFYERVPDLADQACQTFIHGEFYPKNILVFGSEVTPVDWQSGAIGSGSIDLASLLEGWGQGPLVSQAISAYVSRRWGGAAPKGFYRRLSLAQVYWCFRWLGDVPEWTLARHRRTYFYQLRDLSTKMWGVR